ncbi:MAG: alpha/beta fold hydrolase [Actinomycetota bacterium]|nr:alpha/beta fold hydrolase [Actinomycetota bacterium]
MNPGGPGASGVEFVRAAAVDTFPTELRTRFDIVGFDPRGVGASRPITCGGSAGGLLAHDLDPDDDAERRAVISAAQRTARDCEATDGDVLPHVSTADVARDLDLLRAALGDARLTYVGYSYGTFIGSSYAALFPDRVRALVLDGAIDPTLDAVGRARGAVLVCAHRSGRPEHPAIATWLREVAEGDEAFGLADLVLSGFLRIVTHPRIFDVPSPLTTALVFVRELRERPNCVDVRPGTRHWDLFVALCEQVAAKDNHVADAYLAALAIESGDEWSRPTAASRASRDAWAASLGTGALASGDAKCCIKTSTILCFDA